MGHDRAGQTMRRPVSEQRLGARLVKRYDQPRTPLSAPSRKQVNNRTNPAELQRRIPSPLHQPWRLGRQQGTLARKLG
jgi:hypothetical protein